MKLLQYLTNKLLINIKFDKIMRIFKTAFDLNYLVQNIQVNFNVHINLCCGIYFIKAHAIWARYGTYKVGKGKVYLLRRTDPNRLLIAFIMNII